MGVVLENFVRRILEKGNFQILHSPSTIRVMSWKRWEIWIPCLRLLDFPYNFTTILGFHLLVPSAIPAHLSFASLLHSSLSLIFNRAGYIELNRAGV